MKDSYHSAHTDHTDTELLTDCCQYQLLSAQHKAIAEQQTGEYKNELRGFLCHLYDVQSLLIQALANSSAGMDQSELLSLVAGLFDDSSL